jgi:ARC6-like, IMS domain
MPTARTIDGQRDEIHSQEIPLAAAVNSSKLVPASKSGQLARHNGTTGAIVRRRQRRKPNIPRILLVGTGGLGVACGAVWLANATWNQFQTPDRSPIAKHSPLPDPPTGNRPPARSPSPQPQKPVPVGILTKDAAQQIVETWLSAKTKSLGPEYQTAQLKDILVEPALGRALGRVEAARADGDYIKYQHHVTVASIEQTNPLAPVAIIQAQVREDAEFFDNKKPTPVRSTSNTYSIKYNLVRQDLSGTTPNSRWYVKQIDLIN